MAMWIKGSNNLFNEKAFSELSSVSEDTYNGEDCYKLTPKGVNNLIPFKAKAGETISFSMDISAPNGIDMYVFAEDAEHKGAYFIGVSRGSPIPNFKTTTGTLTLTNDVEYINIRCYGVMAYTPYYIKNIMLNRGDPKPYEPYRPPQKMKPVFKSRNVLSIEDYDGEYNGVRITIKDGKLTLNGTSTKPVDLWIALKKPIKAGTYASFGTENIWCWIAKELYDYTNRVTILRKPADSDTRIATTTYDCNAFLIYYPTNTTYNNETIDLMLAKGDKPLPFEPYFPLTKFKAIPKSRNLFHLPFPNPIKQENGITFTDMGNGGIHIKGTATANAVCGILRDKVFTGYFASRANGTPANKDGYWLSLKSDDLPENYKHLIVAFERYNAEISNNGYFYLLCDAGQTYDCIVYPMLNYGEPLPYEPPQEIWL